MVWQIAVCAMLNSRAEQSAALATSASCLRQLECGSLRFAWGRGWQRALYPAKAAGDANQIGVIP